MANSHHPLSCPLVARLTGTFVFSEEPDESRTPTRCGIGEHVSFGSVTENSRLRRGEDTAAYQPQEFFKTIAVMVLPASRQRSVTFSTSSNKSFKNIAWIGSCLPL